MLEDVRRVTPNGDDGDRAGHARVTEPQRGFDGLLNLYEAGLKIVLRRRFITLMAMLGTIALTALEFLVAALQAYVFAILTSLYINDAIHPGH